MNRKARLITVFIVFTIAVITEIMISVDPGTRVTAAGAAERILDPLAAGWIALNCCIAIVSSGKKKKGMQQLNGTAS